MRKGSTIAVLSLGLAATTVPNLVDAKSYHGDGYRLRDRAMTSRNVRSTGDSITCLTSEARNLLARIRSKFN
ncbi:MAG: peptidase M15, partial [Hyphomicrobium sp.]|nr:peptidase M15 [Hyphomicrobium sp.]